MIELTTRISLQGSYWLSYRPTVKVELIIPKFITRFSTLRVPVPAADVTTHQLDSNAVTSSRVEQREVEGVDSDSPAYQENMV